MITTINEFRRVNESVKDKYSIWWDNMSTEDREKILFKIKKNKNGIADSAKATWGLIQSVEQDEIKKYYRK